MPRGADAATADAGRHGDEMPDEQQGKPTDGSSAAGTQQTQGDIAAQLDALRAENAKLAKAIADRNAENKATREKAEAAAAEKAAAEKAAAEKAGEWAKVIEIERAERKRIADEAEALKSKASAADRYEAVFKAEADELAAKLGDRAKKFEHLPLADRVVLYRELTATAAGPGAAPAPKAAPAGGPAPQKINWDSLSPEAQREELKKLTPEQRRALAVERGVTHKSGALF